MIEGVLTGISVTRDEPSQVGPLEICVLAGLDLAARHTVDLMCNIHLHEPGLIGDSEDSKYGCLGGVLWGSEWLPEAQHHLVQEQRAAGVDSRT